MLSPSVDRVIIEIPLDYQLVNNFALIPKKRYSSIISDLTELPIITSSRGNLNELGIYAETAGIKAFLNECKFLETIEPYSHLIYFMYCSDQKSVSIHPSVIKLELIIPEKEGAKKGAQ